MSKDESQSDQGGHVQPSLKELFAFEATVNANLQREAEELERAEVMAKYGLTDSKTKKTKTSPEPDLGSAPPPAPVGGATPNPFAV